MIQDKTLLDAIIEEFWKINPLYGGDLVSGADEYVGLLKFGFFEDPEAQPLPQNQQVKVNYTPPIINDNDTTINVYNNQTTIQVISNESVEFPKSKLPVTTIEEEDGQTETKITIGSPLTLSQSANQQAYGQFTFSPFTDSTLQVQKIQSTNFDSQFATVTKASLKKYLTAKIDGETLNVSDSVVYFLPLMLRGLTETMTLGGGMKPLRMLAQYYSSLRVNALTGLVDSIPKEIKVTTKEINFKLNTSGESKLTFFDYLTKQSALGDLLGQKVKWLELIKQYAEEQEPKNNGEEEAIEAENLPDVILNSLAVFYRKIGISDFPLTMPNSLRLFDVDGQGNAKPQDTEKLNNIVDFFFWHTKILDDLFGQFPINIEIEDSDLIQTGDQSLEIKLPNVAETLAEMTGKLLSQESLTNAILAIVQRNLGEIGMTKQVAVKNYYQHIANQEYSGYSTRKGKVDVDFLFNNEKLADTSGETTLAEALEPSTTPIEIDINNDKNTLEQQLAVITEAARIIKAVHFRKFNIGGDLKQQIVDRTKESQAILDKIETSKKQGLDDFYHLVETGFVTTNPELDATKPYNRPFESRPKVKDNTENG